MVIGRVFSGDERETIESLQSSESSGGSGFGSRRGNLGGLRVFGFLKRQKEISQNGLGSVGV